MVGVGAPDHHPGVQRDRLDDRSQHGAGYGGLGGHHQDRCVAVEDVLGELIRALDVRVRAGRVHAERREELEHRVIPARGRVVAGAEAGLGAAQ